MSVNHPQSPAGRVFLSTTRPGDRFVLHLAACLFRSHLEAIDQTLALVKEAARDLALGA